LTAISNIPPSHNTTNPTHPFFLSNYNTELEVQSTNDDEVILPTVKMSSPSAEKRHMDTDVIKLMESKHGELTILGGHNEFCVKFYGPRGTPYEGGIWKV
jgi:hypothetical protein